MNIRRRLWRQLDPEAYEGGGLSVINQIVVATVLLASAAAILETEPSLEEVSPLGFAVAEHVFGLLFLLEYLARLWVEGENPRFGGAMGRIRYALTPAALIDLLALLPSIAALGTTNLLFLRIFRLMRILRLARLGRFSLAMRHLTHAVAERREELFLSLVLAAIVLVFSAAALYFIEGGSNLHAFGSIPRALWWSVCTLTTVGYGEVYPPPVLG